MRWTQGHKSSDVEDRRGQGMGGGLGGAGLLIPLAARFGLPGVLLGLVVLFVLPRFFGGGEQASVSEPQGQVANKEDELIEFSSFVLDDVQDAFKKQFAKEGREYRRAKMVVYTGQTQTGCGYGEAAVGPFYCPLDEQVYIDLTFFRALRQRLGAPGDFAQAYVIAHEVSHHVQNQLGVLSNRKQASVATELQADCFAGVWAKSTEQRKLLESGDLEEAMNAAAAVGDDRVTGGTVAPENWTHGSSAQRMKAFKRGYASGDCQGANAAL